MTENILNGINISRILLSTALGNRWISKYSSVYGNKCLLHRVLYTVYATTGLFLTNERFVNFILLTKLTNIFALILIGCFIRKRMYKPRWKLLKNYLEHFEDIYTVFYCPMVRTYVSVRVVAWVQCPGATCKMFFQEWWSGICYKSLNCQTIHSPNW